MEIIKIVKEYLRESIKVTENILEIGEGTIPLRNLLASDKKILALLEGKSMKEACKIEQETQKRDKTK